ncbi:MAG: MAPEG family protein [Oscillatoriales cyanobacterium SM2_2_1]|nr:MAPEG family protein [Oscillatoriales cyanobacterium SM2_2_1]
MDLGTLSYPAFVSALALLLYFGLGIWVGASRVKHQIMPPRITGNEQFEQVFRAHQNTLEQLMLFLPSLWLYAVFLSPTTGAIAGMIWVVGRLAYAIGYASAPQNRMYGNSIASLALLYLLIGVLWHCGQLALSQLQ